MDDFLRDGILFYESIPERFHMSLLSFAIEMLAGVVVLTIAAYLFMFARRAS